MRRIAQDIKIITNAPLIVCSTGRTTISATRVIFTKTEAENSFLSLEIKNSYFCESNFFKASSDKSLQMVAFSLSYFARR